MFIVRVNDVTPQEWHINTKAYKKALIVCIFLWVSWNLCRSLRAFFFQLLDERDSVFVTHIHHCISQSSKNDILITHIYCLGEWEVFAETMATHIYANWSQKSRYIAFSCSCITTRQLRYHPVANVVGFKCLRRIHERGLNLAWLFFSMANCKNIGYEITWNW